MKTGEAVSRATDCMHVSQHFDAFLVACAPCINKAMEEYGEAIRKQERERASAVAQSIGIKQDHAECCCKEIARAIEAGGA